MAGRKKTSSTPDQNKVRLPQIESVRLYRQIADLLSTRIDQGLFPAGSFLPAERELAEQLGVSRTTVREALIALEMVGRISIRHGQGVQVLDAAQNRAVSGQADNADLSDIGPVQILEARRVIEAKTAELAAINHTAEHLALMRDAIALQTQATTANARQYRDGDKNFHMAIAEASGNPAYVVVVASLWELRTKTLFLRFEDLLVGPDRPHKTGEEHLAIYEAIEKRDSKAAGRLMKSHIDAVLRAFIEGVGPQ